MSIWTLAIAGRFPMLRVRQFINNPGYIFYFLKRFVWYKYISHRYIPQYAAYTFLSGKETINRLMTCGCSLARFSDGEIDLLTGMGVFDPKMTWSQPYSPELRDALIVAMTATHPDLLIAHTSPAKFLADKTQARRQGIAYTMWTDTRLHLHKYLTKNRPYGDAHAFIPQDNPHIDWNGIKSFLKVYDVVVVTGGVAYLRSLALGRRTFFIEAGAHDAFSRYDAIVKDIKKVFSQENLQPKSTLILASLGPTASVLAVDLTRQGYLIWDSGHIFKYAADKLQ